MTRSHLTAADRSAIARAAFALRSRVIGAERGPTRTALEITKNAAALRTRRRVDGAGNCRPLVDGQSTLNDGAG